MLNSTSWGLDPSLVHAVNPWGISLELWAAAVVVKAAAVLALDQVLFAVLRGFKFAKMPTRDPKIAKGLERLQWMDYAFVMANQVIETVFVMHLVWYMWHDAGVSRAAHEVSIGNVVVPVYFIFVVDDFIYYFTHRAMHHPVFYRWCHKHHHRQSIPFRGYMDAANESPIEQLLGLSALWVSIKLCSRMPFGLHAVGIAAFFAVYACTAFLNHTDYDLQPGWLALGYTVRAHEMHHRFPNCNYAQNIMLWDKLFGTFEEYKDKSIAKAR